MSKRTQFEKDLDNFYVNSTETCFNFSLKTPEVNAEAHRKWLREMYKTKKQIDREVLSVKHRGGEEEIVVRNNCWATVKAKGTLLNSVEDMPLFSCRSIIIF